MKIIKKALAIVLSGAILFLGVACGTGDKKKGGETAATIPLIRNGYSRYKILISDEANGNEKYAANELQYFMKCATEYEFDVVTEKELSEGERYISIGHTEKLEESDISFDNDKLGRSGFRIVSEGGNVYLFGADNGEGCGTIYSVYKFLQDTIGYVYYSDLTVYYENKSEVYMRDYELTEIPTFDVRELTTLETSSNNDYATRLRLTPDLSSTTVSGHSHFTVIDPDVYYADHPDWFNPQLSQLCLSNEEMTLEFANNLIEFIKKEPTADTFMLGMMDNYDGCTCEICTHNIEEWAGTYAGINNAFMNKVAEICDEWLAQNQPERKLTYRTYVYYATEKAPVKEIKRGNEVVGYEPYSSKVVCRDNVQMQIAYINMNRNKPMDHTDSLYYYENLKAWSTVCGNIRSYNYLCSYNTNGYMYALNDFDTVERNIRIWRDNGVRGMYYVFGYWVTNVGCLYDMKAYCLTQLLWNADLSYAELADDFMKKSYLAAEPYMREYYNVYRAWMTNYEETVSTDTSFGVMYGTKMLPKALMDKLYSLIDEAYAAIEVYRESDPELYENVKTKIEKEEVMPLYAYLCLYWDSFNQNQRADMINRLELLTNKFDFRYYGENHTMASQINSWKSKNQ